MTEVVSSPPVIEPLPQRRGDVLALRVVQSGAIAIVLAVSTYFAFELDRFFVPKEIALHLTALLGGLLIARSFRDVTLTRVDLFLLVYLGVSVLSAIFATNRWAAMRSIAMTASGLAIFWIARTLRLQGLGERLLNALAAGIVLIATTSLLQTYGVETTLFSENRAPGGTLGNRNFVAHAGAFGLSLIVIAAMRARTTLGFFAGAMGAAIVVSSLVLTRSRGAWLGFAVVVVVFALAILVSAPLRRDGRTWRRILTIALLAAGSVAAALTLPNTLRWRSDNPYLDTVENIADYEEGSGRGRLVQYEHSLRMAIRHPILGAGPGNWPVEYPDHAARRDPSMSTRDGGMTVNPWPSSDWIAVVSERGFAAAILLALAFAAIALHALRQLYRALTVDEGLVAAALLATIAGALVTGAFDAVLLLALPTLFVWAGLGALWVPAPAPPNEMKWRALVVLLLVVISAAGAARSISQLVAMGIYATTNDRSALQTAARLDPSNYRLRMRLARISSGESRCRHAVAAHALFPNAHAAADIARRCDQEP